MTRPREELAARGRLAARELLRKRQIRAVEEIDLLAIAWHEGVEVRFGGLAGARGRLTKKGSRGIVRVADRISEEAQQRFVIAHELGHHLMHSVPGAISLCSDRDLTDYAPRSKETEANVFAAELLMPRFLFEPRCDVREPNLDVVLEIGTSFRTTITATALRFVELCPEPCALVWCEGGVIRWAFRGPEFSPWISSGRRLDGQSHAHDAFLGQELPKKPELVPLSAWADGGSRDVMEHTLYFTSLRATLTLLWLPSNEG